MAPPRLFLSVLILSATSGLAAANRWNETERLLNHPEGVRILVNTPENAETAARQLVVFYALPNGNTIEQTAGKLRTEGVHWRYDIQHIAAQTRALRAADPDSAWHLVYLEADGKSWPTWRRNRPEGGDQTIANLVDEIVEETAPGADIILTGHSGGGSFTFGFLNAHESIPDTVTRIAFLDSNYGFDAELGHGRKLVEWLEGDESRTLVVLAYDDRNVELDGKRIVSDTGGTWRATYRMIDAMKEELEFTAGEWGDYEVHRAPGVEMLLHRNPGLKILHTALIGERNGYIHAMTLRTDLEGQVATFDGPRGYEEFIDDSEAGTPEPPAEIPPRPDDAPTGTEFFAQINDLPREEREVAIQAELLRGNIPNFLRELKPVTVETVGLEGTKHQATFHTMPDYLAIGTDEDHVCVPMNPYTAQAFCDAYGFFIPTRHMVNAIWKAADVKLEPHPLTEEREAAATFLQHHNIVEQQRVDAPLGAIVAGIKKDVVISNRLAEKPNRVAIFGWHYQDGKPIQPLTIVHVDWYVDYSHGVRPVRALVEVDGKVLRYDEILADPHLHGLLSDEGEIRITRYEAPKP